MVKSRGVLSESRDERLKERREDELTKKEVVPVKENGLLKGMMDSMLTRRSCVRPCEEYWVSGSGEEGSDGTDSSDEKVRIELALLLLPAALGREEGRSRRELELRQAVDVDVVLHKDERRNRDLVEEVLQTSSISFRHLPIATRLTSSTSLETPSIFVFLQ